MTPEDDDRYYATDMERWAPMSSAPREKAILAADSGGSMYVVSWCYVLDEWAEGDCSISQLMIWRHLPELPPLPEFGS